MHTRFTSGILALVLGTALPAALPGQRDGALPPVPAVTGKLAIRVEYPAAGSAIAAGDSTFLFGTVGDGRATLTIDGRPVRVAANGAWLAWVAIPRDSAFALRLQARRGSESASVEHPLVRAGWVRESGVWVDRGSMAPVGAAWLPIGEPLPLVVRAVPGATVRLIIPGGMVIPFAADSIPGPVPAGIRAFDRDPRNLARRPRGDRYVATVRDALLPATTPWLAPGAGGRRPAATLEVAIDGDTTRVPWELSVTRRDPLGSVVRLDDDPADSGGTDRTTVGRTVRGGTYTWFFPRGTRAHAEARIGDDVRLRLAQGAIAWVPVADVHAAAAGDDARLAAMGSLTVDDRDEVTALRVPLTHAVPHRVEETARGATITLFGTVADADWTRYDPEGEFVSLITWRQESADRVTLDLTFDRPVWGYRVRVDGTDLVFEFRQPPAIDPAHPLRGRHIVLDPGHPPGGACGPTRLCEPEANLAVAERVRTRLEAEGARVTMTRRDPRSVGLYDRVALADSVQAEVLISIHNNAFPDGVNPFTNSGTTTFFNHPRSLPLARAVQSRLVAQLGLRNLGVARGDLALVRPTWYPAILTEGLYLMVPEQEAAMRSAAGQARYAAGVVEGLTTFLRNAARVSTPPRAARP